MRKWEKEHGLEYAVPSEIDALVDKGMLSDESWHNDTHPMFYLVTPNDAATDKIELWVDHADIDHREDPAAKRFVVSADCDGEMQDLFESDSLAELLFYLKDHWEVA